MHVPEAPENGRLRRPPRACPRPTGGGGTDTGIWGGLRAPACGFAAEPPSVQRIAARPDKVEATGSRSFRYLEEVNDPFGGTSRLSFDARLFPNVVRLDSNPLVKAVSCRPEGSHDVVLSDASGAEAFTPGIIVAGSAETWSCPNTAGVNAPFTKGIVNIAGLTLHLRAADGAALSADVPGASVPAFSLALSRSGGALWAAGAAVPS